MVIELQRAVAALSARLDRPSLAAVTVVRIVPDPAGPAGWRLAVAADPRAHPRAHPRAAPPAVLERAVRAVVGDVPLRLEAAPPARRDAARPAGGGKQDHHAVTVGGLLIRVPGGMIGTTCIVARRPAWQAGADGAGGGAGDGPGGGGPGGGPGGVPRGVPSGGGVGVVTAGHVVGGPGVPVYQPRPEDGAGGMIGHARAVVGVRGTAASDSAFVALADAATPTGLIWAAPGRCHRVVGVEPAVLGGRVSMQGAAVDQGERTGRIAATGATVRFVDGGRLTGQLLATYESREGDSGAPVFCRAAADDADAVTLIGLNVGAARIEDVEAGAPHRPHRVGGATADGSGAGREAPAGEAPADGGAPQSFAVVSPWSAVAEDLGGLVL